MVDFSPSDSPAQVKYELWYEGFDERVGKLDRVEVILEPDAEAVAIALRDAVHQRRRVRDLAHCSAANLRLFVESIPDEELSDEDLLRFLLDGAPERLRVVAPPFFKAVSPSTSAAGISFMPSRPRASSRAVSEGYGVGGGALLAATMSASSAGSAGRRDSGPTPKRGDSESVVVFVKTGDQTFPVEVESTAKVDAVKARIKEQEQIPLDQQRLMYAGIELEGSRTLLDYNIHQGCELQLVLMLEASA